MFILTNMYRQDSCRREDRMAPSSPTLLVSVQGQYTPTLFTNPQNKYHHKREHVCLGAL